MDALWVQKQSQRLAVAARGFQAGVERQGRVGARPVLQLREAGGGVGEVAGTRATVPEQDGSELGLGDVEAEGGKRGSCHSGLLMVECWLLWKDTQWAGKES